MKGETALDKKQINIRLTQKQHVIIDALADVWGSKEAVVAAAVELLAPEFTSILGIGAGAIEQSLRAWSRLIVEASAANSKTFTRPEWNYLADVNNGCSPIMFEASGVGGNPGTMFWANAEDGHRLNRAGDKWFPRGKEADKRVAKLVEKVRGLDTAHQWAMVIAVQWFWDRALDIDAAEDAWWTVEFRMKNYLSQSNS